MYFSAHFLSCLNSLCIASRSSTGVPSLGSSKASSSEYYSSTAIKPWPDLPAVFRLVDIIDIIEEYISREDVPNTFLVFCLDITTSISVGGANLIPLGYFFLPAIYGSFQEPSVAEGSFPSILADLPYYLMTYALFSPIDFTFLRWA